MYCPRCSCVLEIDHPGRGYCPFCRVVVLWVDGKGWVPQPDEHDAGGGNAG